MKRWAVFVLTGWMLVLLGGCSSFDVDRVLANWDGLTEWLGSSQFTREEKLIGLRAWSEERYTGCYHAQPEMASGRDVIFGGASIHQRQLKLTVESAVQTGSVTLRIRMGEQVQEYPLADGVWELPLTFDGGGNYVMLDYEQFTGSVTLYSERAEGKTAA